VYAAEGIVGPNPITRYASGGCSATRRLAALNCCQHRHWSLNERRKTEGRRLGCPLQCLSQTISKPEIIPQRYKSSCRVALTAEGSQSFDILARRADALVFVAHLPFSRVPRKRIHAASLLTIGWESPTRSKAERKRTCKISIGPSLIPRSPLLNTTPTPARHS